MYVRTIGYPMDAVLFAVGLALLTPASEAQQAGKIHMHGAGGYAADGLLFEPAGPGPFAALLLIPDAWGLTQRAIDEAKHWADSGYVVVAVDLYRGEIAVDAERAAQLSAALSPDRAMQDLKAALGFVAAQQNVRFGHVGVISWQDGADALRLATSEPILAVVIDTCSPPTEVPPLTNLHAAVLANFGGCDRAVPEPVLHQLKRALAAQGKTPNIKIYPRVAPRGDAKQGHMRPAVDARDSAARTAQFLAKTLGEPTQAKGSPP